MSPQSLQHALLAPAMLHILRAAGFHSTRASVLDTLTDLCARYILLLAGRLVEIAYNRAQLSRTDMILPFISDDSCYLADHGNGMPTSVSSLDHDTPGLSDLRQTLEFSAVFASALTATEEAWQEQLRKPLVTIPLAGRDKERNRRDLQDTKDVRDFLDWVTGPVNREIRRIAGLLPDEQMANSLGGLGAPSAGLSLADFGNTEKDDYLTMLKKKHSKTADAARFSGTALGRMGDERGSFKVEGGPSLAELRMNRRRANAPTTSLEADSERTAT